MSFGTWLRGLASSVFGSSPEEGSDFEVGGDASINTGAHVHTVEIDVPEVGSVVSKTQFGPTSVSVGGTGKAGRSRAASSSGSGGGTRTP